MIDMVALGEELASARAEVLADPRGILTLARRTRIWVAMDDPADAEASYRHRTYLKIACVRHVQHLWYQAYPGDPRLEEMLTLTQALTDQTVDPRQAESRADTFVNWVDFYAESTGIGGVQTWSRMRRTKRSYLLCAEILTSIQATQMMMMKTLLLTR